MQREQYISNFRPLTIYKRSDLNQNTISIINVFFYKKVGTVKNFWIYVPTRIHGLEINIAL